MNPFHISTEQKINECRAAVRHAYKMQTYECSLTLEKLSRQLNALLVRDKVMSGGAVPSSRLTERVIRMHRAILMTHQLVGMAMTVRGVLEREETRLACFMKRHRVEIRRRRGYWFALLAPRGKLLMQSITQSTLKQKFAKDGTRGIICRIRLNPKNGDRYIIISGFLDRPRNLKDEKKWDE